MKATRLDDTVEVLYTNTCPDGNKFVVVPCADYDELRKLPKAIEFNGERYGRTGWNSDTCAAYYRNPSPPYATACN